MDILDTFKEIDGFLGVARSVGYKDWSTCRNVFQLFGIDAREPYPQMKDKIDAFINEYQQKTGGKFRTFSKEVSPAGAKIKRVLKDYREEYLAYIKENDPDIKALKHKFEGFTDIDKILGEDEESRLIEDGLSKKISKKEITQLIEEWLSEYGASRGPAGGGATAGDAVDPFTVFLRQTYYQILGVAPAADYAVIKAAYEAKINEINRMRDKKVADARRVAVNQAWKILKDPVRRREYDESTKAPPPPTGPDKPRLVVERQSAYFFHDLRRGGNLTEKIVIKNPERGVLKGSISSDATWLQTDRDHLLDKHEQELYIHIFSARIPTRTYKVQGHVTIDTNGGKDVIPVEVVLENYEVELARFKHYYVFLAAALAAFLFALPFGIAGALLAGGGVLGLGLLLSRYIYDLLIDRGVDLSRFPLPLARGLALGLVASTLLIQAWPYLSNSRLSSTGIKTPPIKSPPDPQGIKDQHEHLQSSIEGLKGDIGPQTVWNYPGGAQEVWRKIHDECGFGLGKVNIECIAAKMKQLGASPQAIAFTEMMKGEVYMGSFKEMGRVDLAKIIAPCFNDPNVEDYILVNGNPKIVKLWNYARRVNIKNDKIYPSLVSEFPKTELWPMQEFETMQILPQDGQRFIFNFALLNGCRACEVVGSAQIAFDFDREGRFKKTSLIRLVRERKW